MDVIYVDEFRPPSVAIEMTWGVDDLFTLDEMALVRSGQDCRVYWGSHGCKHKRGHKSKHVCSCGGKPYHGDATDFYGEDAPTK